MCDVPPEAGEEMGGFWMKVEVEDSRNQGHRIKPSLTVEPEK